MRTTSDTAVLRKPFSSIEVPIAAFRRWRWPAGRGRPDSSGGAAVAAAGTLPAELAADDDARAASRDHRDVALPRRLGRRVGRLQIAARDDRAQHDALLGHSKRRAETAAYAASERDPRVGPRFAPQEALGTEGVGLWIDVLAMVERHDAHGD